MRRGKIIVFGIAFWYPLGGVAWQFLHYLLGLKRLGYDVYYVEDSDRDVYDPAINDFTPDAAANVAAVAPFFEAHGFAERWCLRTHGPHGRCYGMSESQVAQLYRDAEAFLNVTGSQELRDEQMAIPRRVYVETDPVVSQIEVARRNPRTIAELAGHDRHFTYGENIGKTDCPLPALRFNWMPTRQPVVLELWRTASAATERPYTTVATWENRGRDVEFDGRTYLWSKHHEFMKFIDLPLRARKDRFELAVTVDGPTEKLLGSKGWSLTHSLTLSRDFEGYQRYIQSSRGEFTVAKDQNIRLRSGWFSDRAACYLAAGRPCIEQETGFSDVLPVGEGLFGFRTYDDILLALEMIRRDYPAACRAAAAIADECFAAEKVLASLMSRAGL
jgi:hypothetical protein